MLIKDIVDVDVVNYRLTSMFIVSVYCNWKCCLDGGFPVSICQNNTLANEPNISISNQKIADMYLNNKLSHAVVFGGLEPMLQYDDVKDIIKLIREKSNDDIVIYTGYTKEEIIDKVIDLQNNFKNIIIKFGRFQLDQPHHFDEVLGVELASPNQYAERIC